MSERKRYNPEQKVAVLMDLLKKGKKISDLGTDARYSSLAAKANGPSPRRSPGQLRHSDQVGYTRLG